MKGVDFHAHLAPALSQEDLRRHGLTRSDEGKLVADEGVCGPPSLERPDLLERHLDAAGLREAVVSIPPPLYRQHLSADASREWVRRANDGLLDAVGENPRLVPLAYLPLEHPEVALAEYERISALRRFAGITASAGGRSLPISSPTLATLLGTLDEAAELVVLHPGTSPDIRLDGFYLANLLGNPVETTIAAAHLLFGRILTTYERARFVLAHGGGCVPSLVGRWQRAVDTRRPGVPDLDIPIGKLVKRMFADCLVHDSQVLDLAIAVFGSDKMLLGSDWPYPMGVDNPKELVNHLPSAVAESIASANAYRALGRD